MSASILTDAFGRPLEPPAAPAFSAPIEERIMWLRDYAAFNDRVGSLATSAFAKRFRRAVRAR